MGNGVSSDQGNLPSYGRRDVRRAADRKQHDWSELAIAPETNSLLATANSYSSSSSKLCSEKNFTLLSIPTYVITVLEHHGRTDTDGQTTCGITALCVDKCINEVALLH